MALHLDLSAPPLLLDTSHAPMHLAGQGPTHVSKPLAIARNHRFGGTVAKLGSVSRSTIRSEAR